MKNEDRLNADVLIVGAGVIGLSIASQLSSSLNLILVEENPQFGQGTSSRNSEVIHAGIYYPSHSKKTEWCVEGRAALYEFCRKRSIPFLRTGKFVVATTAEETAYLEKLLSHCRELGVPVEMVSGERLRGEEPLVKSVAGLFSPETGVVDSHALMKALEFDFEAGGGILAYRHKVLGFERSGQSWVTRLLGPEGEVEVLSDAVVNAAGLASAELSNLAFQTTRYEHRYCRGRYFHLSSAYTGKFRHLVYPVPPKDGLGVHVTLDTAGNAKLGPDVDWCPGVTYRDVSKLYDCDWEALRPSFLAAVNQYAPTVQAQEISPGQIGVRGKLFVEGRALPDFLVENLDGFIHCLGVESPGLTSSLAIARYVKTIL